MAIELNIENLIFLLTGVLISILSWFVIDFLSTRRARKRKAFELKAERYEGISQAIDRTLTLIGILDNIQDIDENNKETINANLLKTAGLIFLLPSREAIEWVIETANEVLEVDEEEEESESNEENEIEKQIEIIRALKTAIWGECWLGIKEEFQIISDCANSLKILGLESRVSLEIDEVGKTLGERIGVIGMATFYENLDLKGLVKKEDLDKWMEEAREKINKVEKTMKEDLKLTL